MSRYSLVNQVIDEFNDATGIDTSASSQYVLESGYIFGGTSTSGNATGGNITTVSGYKYHEFTHTGTLNGSGSGSYTTSYNFVVLALERLSTLSLEVVDEEKVHILVGTKLVTVKVEKVVKDNITLVIQLQTNLYNSCWWWCSRLDF